jgi:multidrug efflux pump subunit AcrB
MLTRFSFLTVASAIAVVGCTYPAPARPEQADATVLLVAASYPGANAQVVADTVAAAIEQHVNGVEGMVRIESTSGNDGQYTARLYFKPKTDPKSAMKRVQSRVALAEPVLPDVVRRNKVAVKVGKAEAGPSKVVIAVIDHGDNGWKALQKVGSAVVKRLAAEDALTKPQVFPRDEKQVSFDVDGAKCNSLGVTLTDVSKAVQAAGPAIKPEGLKKVVVRDKVTLGDVAAIKEVFGPAAVNRVDLSPAIRITAAPAEGKSVVAAVAKSVDLTEAEMKRLGSRGFAVENLSAK